MADLYDKKILIIDDDSSMVELVTSILRKHGVEAHGETTSVLGIKTAQDIGADLIILDHHMSGENGDEILHSLKQNPDTQDIPVVVLTGEKDEGVSNSYLKLGASGYVIKPFQPGDFIALLEKAFDKHADT